MKNTALVLVVFCLLLFQSGCKQGSRKVERPQNRSIWSRWFEHKGAVKNCIQYKCTNYYLRNGQIDLSESDCKISTISEFSEDTILIKEVSYDSYPDQIHTKIEVKLNPDGRVSEDFFQSTGPMPTASRGTFSYDERGNCLSAIRVDENGNLKSKDEYEYDQFNCEIKHISYSRDNQISFSSKSEYNDNNQIVKDYTYDKNGELKGESTYEYDSDGELIFKKYERVGDKTTETNYEESYSKNSILGEFLPKPSKYLSSIKRNPESGKIQSCYYKNSSGQDVSEIFDNQERVIERKFMNGNQWIKTQNWRYREDGALLEESESSSQYVGRSFFKRSTFYKVDNNGNWIEMYSTDSEGGVYNLYKRSIEYYPSKIY